LFHEKSPIIFDNTLHFQMMQCAYYDLARRLPYPMSLTLADVIDEGEQANFSEKVEEIKLFCPPLKKGDL
jgi:hypothetical protein